VAEAVGGGEALGFGEGVIEAIHLDADLRGGVIAGGSGGEVEAGRADGLPCCAMVKLPDWAEAAGARARTAANESRTKLRMSLSIESLSLDPRREKKLRGHEARDQRLVPSLWFLRPCFSAFGQVEAAIDFVPVDDVPPRGEVIGAAVLVLEVVGVLPNVVEQDGINALREGRILVGSADHLELACLEDQPAPAGAKLLGGGLVEGLLEGLEVAEVGGDLRGDGPDGAPPRPRSRPCP